MIKQEVTDLRIPELAIYQEARETQLYHINEPGPGIFIAESPNVILRALDAGYEPLSFFMDTGQWEKAEPLLQDQDNRRREYGEQNSEPRTDTCQGGIARRFSDGGRFAS